MELSNVKEIITPQGNLKKILRGDVVIWSKKASDLKYTIWKNGELIDRITMSQFVNKIQNGDAQTDYGIGAQIMIPYTDPFNDVTYDCPFNFGTFTQYPGKLGLQTHYALPSKAVAYGTVTIGNTINSSSNWETSYIYHWLNTSGISYSSKNFNGKNGFLSCLPADFVNRLQDIPTGKSETPSKFFLLTATQYYVDTELITVEKPTNTSKGNNINCFDLEHEKEAWEYWINRISSPQICLKTTNDRIIYSLSDNKAANIVTITPGRKILYKSGVSAQYTNGLYYFSVNGSCNIGSATNFKYQPACVIG